MSATPKLKSSQIKYILLCIINKRVQNVKITFIKDNLLLLDSFLLKTTYLSLVFVVVASLGCGSLCVVMLHSEDMHDGGLIILTW